MQVHRKQYLKIFGWLTVLTLLEVGITYAPVSKVMIAVGLVGMAFTKAAMVALHFMHLGSETLILRRTVFIPLMLPPFYALVLISEAIARRL